MVVLLATAFLLTASLCPGPSWGAPKIKVAVLPFQLHTQEPLSHLQVGFQDMLIGRIQRLGFQVIPRQTVNANPLVFSPNLDQKDLLGLASDLDVDWVLYGSLTQVGGKLSVDITSVPLSTAKAPFHAFSVAETSEVLQEAAGHIALAVDGHIRGVAQVDSVTVKGNKRVEREAILAVAKTRPGERLDMEALDKDLRDIYKMGFFQNVELETEDGSKGKIVIFKVTEKPSIQKIVFEGNDKYSSDDLKKEIGIEPYTILDPSAVRQGINKLKEFYRQKGYFNAEIQDKIEPLPNNEVLLKYLVTENEKVYIVKISFEGNEHYTDKQLKKTMETSEKGLFEWFSWFTNWGLLDEKKLEFDAQKITSFYHNNGYITARVGEPKVAYDEAQKGLVITIPIHEGPLYHVDRIGVEGDLIKPADELLKKVKVKTGDIFNREMVRRDAMALRDVYTDEGYAYAEVVPNIKEDPKTNTANVTYRATQGKKVRFERIEITGNDWTRDKVIRRELKAMEGEYFSGEALKRSTENLNRLGFFESIEVETKKGSADDLMVLEMKVKEKATRSFSVGAGYSSAYAGFVTFQVADNNFFGYGQKLEASARLGGKQTEFDIRFIEPWLFDRPMSLEADIYRWKQEYDDYTRASLGGAVTYGVPIGLDDYTRGTVTYNYDDAKISDVAATASSIIQDMVGRHVTSSMTLGVIRDNRNRPWNTSKGSVNSFSFEYAGGILQGNEYFNKYRARSEWFFPLFWDTVFLARGQAGYVQQRSGGDLSAFQKFRIGGLDTVRGYPYASISPVDPETGDKIGGTKMMCYTAEYRFPVLKEQGVIGLFFFDAGNVFGDDENWTFNGIKKSVGAGVRWLSPIGPLRLEYGFVVDRQPGDPRGRWEFSVGGLF